ncbi:MAG: SURF1 family protein [Nocardioides sp.]
MSSEARSLRFLLSRRWIFLLVFVLVWGYACLLLGRWQWHRLESRRAGNTIIQTNESASPRPVDEVLKRGVDPPGTDQYAVVSATGTYEPSQTVVIRYQTRDGNPGVDVVVPLMTSTGTALLVDRGWFQTSNEGGTDASQVPAPPSGTVRVTGWVRQDAGGSSTDVVDASARSISSAKIGPAIGVPVYGGFVQLLTESPAAATPLTKADAPGLGDGPHFFYALQWWFFGILGLFGYLYLAWEERTGRAELRRTQQPTRKRSPSSVGQSEGAGRPAIDRQHASGDERRGGAEQERSSTAEL